MQLRDLPQIEPTVVEIPQSLIPTAIAQMVMLAILSRQSFGSHENPLMAHNNFYLDASPPTPPQ
jgi:hypothetical protein